MASVEEQNEIAVQAKDFRNKVDSVLEAEDDRAKLLDALRNYHESKKIKRLVRDLKIILDTIKKYSLFKEIRALIPSEHLFAYDKLTEGARTGERIVHLKRHGNEPLGFKFKGGKEHGIGVYVTSIVPGSAAHASGLKIGDEILKVNSLVLHESIHDEVTNLLKNKRSVTFVTRNMGKIPNKENNRIVWQDIDPNMRIGPPDLWDSNFINLAVGQPQTPKQIRKDDRMLAFKIGREGLGCSIRSGIANHDGVYVSAISTNSLAEQVGLKVGDQILNVNGRGFEKVKHSEAVEALKARKDLTMIVRYNEDVAAHFMRKSKPKSEILVPILIQEGDSREVKKKATFGEKVVVEIIEDQTAAENGEYFDEEEEEIENDEPGKSNFEYDEEITQGREVQFVSILKTAPLMIDLEMKNERIVIRNVVKGGAASDNGYLKRGDVLLNVEGTDLFGLSLQEAQEALSESMGRLTNHIDITVACPPGRKPPGKKLVGSKLDINALALTEDNLSVPGLGRRRQSVGSSEEDAAKLSSVAKAIAVFESNAPKRNQFLVRRDSLEKARNSLRLYKEKRRSSLVHSEDYVGSPKLTPSKSSSSSPTRKTHDHGSPVIGSHSSPASSKKPAFAMLDPTPVFPIGRVMKQTRSFDSSEEEEMVMFSKDGNAKRVVELHTGNMNENGLDHPSSSAFDNSSSVAHSSHFKPLSDASRDLSMASNAKSSNEQRYISTSSSNTPEKLHPPTQPASATDKNAQELARSRVQSYGEPPSDDSEIEFSPNRRQVRAQVHSPPMSSTDDMIASWAPTSPLRTFANENSIDKKLVTFQENKATTGNRRDMRSRSLDNLMDEADWMPQNVRDMSGKRAPRKKSVGFRDTVENIDPTDVTLYKSLDDISMVGKNGWGRRKTHENPSNNLLSPKKSALRNSPSPVPAATVEGDNIIPPAVSADYGNVSSDENQISSKPNNSASVFDIKRRFEDDSELPSHLKDLDGRSLSSQPAPFGKVSKQDVSAKEAVADDHKYKTYRELIAAGSEKESDIDEMRFQQNGDLKNESGRITVQGPLVRPGFVVPSQHAFGSSEVGSSAQDEAARPKAYGMSETEAPNVVRQKQSPGFVVPSQHAFGSSEVGSSAQDEAARPKAYGISEMEAPNVVRQKQSPGFVVPSQHAFGSSEGGSTAQDQAARPKAYGMSETEAPNVVRQKQSPGFVVPSQHAFGSPENGSTTQDEAARPKAYGRSETEEPNVARQKQSPSFVAPSQHAFGSPKNNNSQDQAAMPKAYGRSETEAPNVTRQKQSPGFVVPSQHAFGSLENDNSQDQAAMPERGEITASNVVRQGQSQSLFRENNIDIPEPDYEQADDASQRISQPVATPAVAKPDAVSTVKQPDVKSKKKDNSLGLTTRLLSNAKDKLKRVGFKRSSASGSIDGSKNNKSSGSPKSSKAQIPNPPPPPPPPPPPVMPQTSQSTSSKLTSLQSNQQASLLEQLQKSPVRKAGPSEVEAEASGLERGSHARKEASLSGSMHAGVASEMTENVKIAAVMAGDEVTPRGPLETSNSRPKPPPLNDLLNELKGRVKSHEARSRLQGARDVSDADKDHASPKKNPASDESAGPRRPQFDRSPRPADVKESRISRRQAQGVTEVDSLDISQNSTSVTPRSARGEKDSENALLEMEGTLKAFDDVIRSLDTEL